MILGISKFGRLHLFQDHRDAEVSLEAIDVSEDEMEFCDDQGRPYQIHYIEPPKRFFFGLLIGIGRFELILDPFRPTAWAFG